MLSRGQMRGAALLRPWAARAAAASAGSPVPDLYSYDLCPFCTRARMIFGLKGIRHRLIFMSYDDAETPVGLIGKKLAPILHMPGEAPMAESLDIVRRLDQDATWGPPLLQPATGREDLAAFDRENWPVVRNLVHTRLMHAPLPDLALKSARDYFMDRHPLEDPSTGVRLAQSEWGNMDQASRVALYKHHMADTSRIAFVNASVVPSLEQLLHSEESVSPGGVGYDDVLLFGRMRYITLVRGVELGPKTKAYLANMSEKTDIPLLSAMAM